MQSILEALGIEEPDLVFHFSRNHGIVPSTEEKDVHEWKTEYMEGFRPFSVPQNYQHSTYKATTEEASIPVQVPETIQTENGFTGTFTNVEERLLQTPSNSRNPLETGTTYSESTKHFGLNKRNRDKKHFDVAAFADPNDELDSERIRLIEGNADNLFTAIAEFQKTLFLITKPFRGNTLSEIACKAAAECRQKTVTLGLFHTDNTNPGGNFTVVKDVRETTSEYELRLVQEAKQRRSSDFYEAWDDRMDLSEDKFRMPVPSSIFEFDCVANGEVPQKAIKVDCEFTEYERMVYEMNNHVQHIPGGLANECSHRLVFATSEQKKAFTKVFTDFFATGYFACGATHSEIVTASKALMKGQPLFVIQKTGAVASIIEQFLKKEQSAFNHSSSSSENMRATMSFKTSEKLNTNVERFLSRNTLSKALSLLDANIGMFNNFNADAHYVSAENFKFYSPCTLMSWLAHNTLLY